MRLSEFFGRFIYTRKCPSCYELLDYDLSGEAFCAECRGKWDRAKIEECRLCGRAICECTCMTKAIKSSGALCHHKVVKYSVKSPIVHNTLIFIKKNNNPRVSDFLAAQLVTVLKADVDISDIISSDTVVAFVPRSRGAIVKYGHDQSAILAAALADKLGAAYFPLLRRRRKRSVAQKKLNAKQRAKNVKNMFEIDRGNCCLVEGKTVILVDDIVTTGSSMGACVSHLVKAGARFVICVSVATTEAGK